MSFLPVDFWERFVYIDGVVNWMEYFMGDRSVSVRACLMTRSISAAQLSFRHDRDRAGKEEEWIFNICCFFRSFCGDLSDPDSCFCVLVY